MSYTLDNAIITDVAAKQLIEFMNSDKTYSTPIGCIQAYAGNSTPIGWLLCDGSAISKTVYPNLFEAIGYTYGGSGDSFNLPNLTGRFLEGSSVAGTVKEAGLPNITGSLDVKNADATFDQEFVGTGVITSKDAERNVSYGDGSYSGWAGFDFDASKGGTDPVYGKSTTVQPNSVTVRYIIKAYNSVTTESSEVEIEAQISGISERTAFLEASAIVAQGGNDSTGYYIRYENGTQICWKRQYEGSVSFSAWGNLYLSSDTGMGAMPMPFIAPPVATYSANHATTNWTIIIGVSTPTTSTEWSTLNAIRPSSMNNLGLYFNAYAIGRWK